jgi:hypothetical protein
MTDFEEEYISETNSNPDNNFITMTIDAKFEYLTDLHRRKDRKTFSFLFSLMNEAEKDNYLTELKYQDTGYGTVSLKHYHRYDNGKIKLNSNGNPWHYSKKYDVYTSGNVGSRIRNAITGEYCNDLVGSKNEDKYFKVAYSTGEIKAKNGNHALYFLSPNEYETFFGCDLPDEIINKWNQRWEQRRFGLPDLNEMNRKVTIVK